MVFDDEVWGVSESKVELEAQMNHYLNSLKGII